MQEDHHVMMEVENGVMRLQAKELQGSSATRRGMKHILSQSFRKNQLADT